MGTLGYHSKLDDPAAGSYQDLAWAVFSAGFAGAWVVCGFLALFKRNLLDLMLGLICFGLSVIAARFAWRRALGYRQYYIRRVRELDEEERARKTLTRG